MRLVYLMISIGMVFCFANAGFAQSGQKQIKNKPSIHRRSNSPEKVSKVSNVSNVSKVSKISKASASRSKASTKTRNINPRSANVKKRHKTAKKITIAKTPILKSKSKTVTVSPALLPVSDVLEKPRSAPAVSAPAVFAPVVAPVLAPVLNTRGNGNGELVGRLGYLINSVDPNATIAVYVKSMRNGEQLYTRNIHQPLTPASTMKVLTAEAALLFLKPDYRFSTQLLTDAKTIRNGVLQGNVYVVLSGDPSLTYNDLLDLMSNLRSHQITGIAGNVYIDNTAYDQSFYGPDWVGKDKGNCYAAPISASIINHNCLPFKLSSSTVAGQAARVETSPNFFYPTIKNYVITKPNRSPCSVHLSNDLSSGLAIEGCMSKGKEWGLSYVVTDIPEYNRALFKTALEQTGVKLYGMVSFANVPKNPAMIAQHVSVPLSELVNEMLKKSDNIIAGALFKKLGQLYSNHPGSWQNGSLAVQQILAHNARMNLSGIKILDGSGLSPSNLVAPSQLMQVLDFTYHHTPTNDAFITALPIAGVDGTLKHRMSNIARKVRAKTGYISGVVSLAGYVVTADREVLGFVIMVNGSKGMTWKYKEMEDNIATALARYRR